MATTETKIIENTAWQQKAILDTKQLLSYIKPISHRLYWNVLAKDPRFPKPVIGGNGAKALHSREAIDRFLEEAARTGFQKPDGMPYAGAEH
ncbi:MAG: hypothetical protein H6R10_736 [Rhodocyclaceae bacterium]|nr:hypothetical protein [Rhodocyclaceae bacterium]